MAAATTPAEYVTGAEALMRPAGQVASIVADRAAHPDSSPPARRRLEGIVQRAEDRLADFVALTPQAAVLRRQQGSLAAAYRLLVDRMHPVVDAVVDGRTGARLSAATAPFFASLASLPAVTVVAP